MKSFAALGAAGVLGGTGLLNGCAGRAPEWQLLPHMGTSADLEPLKSAAARINVLYGAATQRDTLQSDSAFAAHFAEECALLVPENELKWETVEPEPGDFDFGPGDWLADFAAQNQMAFRGHCLVWHRQCPRWAGSGTSGEAQQQLTQHILETVSHFAGRTHSWDVVNEAVDPHRRGGLRNTAWLNAIGPSYIELAFRAAREADPNAILVYNETGLEYDTRNGAARRAATLELLRRLKFAEAPVGALGMQAHLSASDNRLHADQLREFIRAVASLGLQVFITELDVSDRAVPPDLELRDAMVGKSYRDFLKAVLQEPAITAVLTWGLSDRYTWLSTYDPRTDGRPVRPLPLDASLRPKTALYAMLESFRGAPVR